MPGASWLAMRTSAVRTAPQVKPVPNTLHSEAIGLGLSALVEVHDERELDAALTMDPVRPALIGINHRDLRTFEVDLGLTARLRKLIPPEIVVVAESGIHSAEDARRMREAGADAVLVGELLMRSADPAGQIRELATPGPRGVHQ